MSRRIVVIGASRGPAIDVVMMMLRVCWGVPRHVNYRTRDWVDETGFAVAARLQAFFVNLLRCAFILWEIGGTTTKLRYLLSTERDMRRVKAARQSTPIPAAFSTLTTLLLLQTLVLPCILYA